MYFYLAFKHILVFYCLFAGGLELFTDLLQRFPNNIHLLLETAKVRNLFGRWLLLLLLYYFIIKAECKQYD